VGVASALPVTCFLFIGVTARAEGPCTTLAASGLGYGPHDVSVKAVNAVSGPGGVDSAHQSVTAPAPAGRPQPGCARTVGVLRGPRIGAVAIAPITILAQSKAGQ
jgi:hypothetical protein